MCHKSIINAASANKPHAAASKIRKIHTLKFPSPAIRATCAAAVSAPAKDTPGHSSLISKWFGVHSTPRFPTIHIPHLPPPSPGQIILITGHSGSGKSSLLRRFRRRCKIPLINIPRIPLSRQAVIDHFPHITIESALRHLSRVGLAEAHCYLLPPKYLSDGQRWRLRLALALSRARKTYHLGGMGSRILVPVSCLFCDEFTSLLDPISACVVARVLRRAITPDSNLCALLACSPTDILRALSPDLIIRCDFGKLELWKKSKGERYEPAGETSAASVIYSRPPRPQTRHSRRLQSS
jgi:ABC-type ATPase with predicted acetyltransferase domain